MDELAVKRAQKLLQAGLEAVARGQVAVALENFRSSAKEHGTADAITYWGWMEHQVGNTEMAIELCKKAIALDPEFGNPYNDIGSYLISQSKFDEAIPWLEKAKGATRYEPRQFPFINLSRAYLAKQMPLKALEELELARKIAPNDLHVLNMLEELKGSIQ